MQEAMGCEMIPCIKGFSQPLQPSPLLMILEVKHLTFVAKPPPCCFQWSLPSQCQNFFSTFYLHCNHYGCGFIKYQSKFKEKVSEIKFIYMINQYCQILDFILFCDFIFKCLLNILLKYFYYFLVMLIISLHKTSIIAQNR